ncbi:hypothetical protein Bpfe_023292, partial [Biomphalaria pfeifferi]
MVKERRDILEVYYHGQGKTRSIRSVSPWPRKDEIYWKFIIMAKERRGILEVYYYGQGKTRSIGSVSSWP